MAHEREVEFFSHGERCRGILRLPEAPDGPVPAVVMAGGWCYVKEVVMPHYADYIVDAGYAVLLFDYRNFGSSEGEPRQHIVPAEQQEDYKSAITFLETVHEVDPDRIGIWGISYSGGHVLCVGATDPRVKCIVSNIPVVDGYQTMRRCHGELQFVKLQQLIMDDRRARGKDPSTRMMMPMSPRDPTLELATWPFPEVREVFEKIQSTEAPAHRHENTVESTDLLMSYTVFPYVPRILKTPTMMVVADEDNITSWDLEIAAFNQIPCTTKELVVLPSQTTHMSLYSQRSRLEIAGTAAARWFSDHL